MHEGLDRLACVGRLRGIHHPDLRERRVDRQLARDARGVHVEHRGLDAVAREQIRDELRLGEVGRAMYAFQKWYEMSPFTPFSFTPDWLDTLKYAIASENRPASTAFTPTALVT